MRRWIAAIGARTAFLEPGSLWEDGCIESFNIRLFDELLNVKMLRTFREVRQRIESWRRSRILGIVNAIQRYTEAGGFETEKVTSAS